MKFKDRIAKLIDVKSIVTLSLTAAFIFMNVAQIEVPETFKTVYIMICGFYFGTQYQKYLLNLLKEDNTFHNMAVCSIFLNLPIELSYHFLISVDYLST